MTDSVDAPPGSAAPPRSRTKLRQPILAEMIADQLRDRIVSGELKDSDSLPKQDELIAEFQVSKPSVREALRILEAEGLITVRRGNQGGAVVHAPKAKSAAYTLGLVLQSRGVHLADLGVALRSLEPLCAALAAGSESREDTVLPALRENVAEAEAAISDPVRFTHIARDFHERIVAGCGSETLRLIVGCLESLWSAHEEDWAWEAHMHGVYPPRQLRDAVLEAHRGILAAIEQGDAAEATRLSQQHLAKSQAYPLRDVDRLIVASKDALRPVASK